MKRLFILEILIMQYFKAEIYVRTNLFYEN